MERTQAEEYAIQQFTGMHYSGGTDVEAVCIGMGLGAEGWQNIKDDCSWLDLDEVLAIEQYIRQN